MPIRTPPRSSALQAFGATTARMEARYAPGVHFHDPVFSDLEGGEAGAMWRMLTGNAKDLKIELRRTPPPAEPGGELDRDLHLPHRPPVVNDIQAASSSAGTA